MLQGPVLRGPHHHAWRLARLEGFLPPRCAEAPPVDGLETAKAEFRRRCRKIVTAGFGKFQKRIGHDGANRVAADILSPGVAATVAKEARHRAYRTNFEPSTEHVARCARPAASIAAVVSQHLLVDLF